MFDIGHFAAAQNGHSHHPLDGDDDDDDYSGIAVFEIVLYEYRIRTFELLHNVLYYSI